jgi:hypothetical protein
MIYFIVLAFITLMSLVIGILMTPKNSTSRRTILNAIIGSIIGAVVPTLIYLQFNIDEIIHLKSKIIEQNNLELLETKVNTSEKNNPFFVSYQNYLEKINKELVDAYSGVILLDDEKEVIDEWKLLFSYSKSRIIKATNIISPRFWLEESGFSKEQLRIQSDAIKNDYTIKRIFIYDESDCNLQELDSLANQQINAGIDVRFISLNRLHSTPIFLKNNSILKGTEDFVISDFNVVLLTIPNPKTKEINHGFICNNREIVDTAMDIFSDLWEIADKTLQK